jgi:hypothetical protein
MQQPPASSATIGTSQSTAADTRLHGRWLVLTRVVWVWLSLGCLVVLVASLPAYFADLQHVCPLCTDEHLTSGMLLALRALGVSPAAYAAYWVGLNVLFAASYVVVAALIFWRRSSERLAWFGALALVTFGTSFPDTFAPLVAAHPAWWLPVALVRYLGFPCLIVFFCLFPDGRFVPSWTRWVAAGFTAAYVPQAFLIPGSPFGFVTPPKALGLLVYGGTLGCLLIAQIYRYRWVSTSVQRQQTKWVVFGLVVALAGFLGLNALNVLLSPSASEQLLFSFLAISAVYLLLLLIPVSIAVALLRYRLWDVDALINKTLVYGSLTALLGAVYASLIIGLQALVRAFTGQLGSNPLVLVISTLAIAALFLPIRRRIQNLIDRRFYRKKYDAEKTLAAFSATLRNEVDLNQLSEQLLAVVNETMQPAQVSLWLRPPEGRAEQAIRLLEPAEPERK